tara:strand:- start:701 stop:913 length:213 start_codon:yes stop_codon:yes gene_type:complete
MIFKLTKNIENNKSFRWGIPIKKYNCKDISQKQLKILWDKGCEFVIEDNKVAKSKTKTTNGKTKQISSEA